MALNGTNTCSIVNAKPNQSGTYTLTVTAKNTAVTSLTSVASKVINISVNKKELGFDWTLPTNKVYSGTTKTISCSHISSDVINGDTITCIVKNDTAKSVGSYTASVELTGACKDLYTIKNSSVISPTLTITPYLLSVTWGQTDFVYNGQTQAPTLTNCLGVGEDGAVLFTILGEQKNAGSYTATAKSKDANYQIANNTKTFNIAKKDLSVSWSNYSGLVYNGISQKPLASLSGVVSGDSVGAVVVGGQTNAGENYTAIADTDNENYEIISNKTTNFNIFAKKISLIFTTTSVEETGEEISVDWVTLSDGVTNSLAGVTYTYLQNGTPLNTAPTQAGEYQVSVSITNTNYALIGETTATITITAKSILG
jgi:hypothetical protein